MNRLSRPWWLLPVVRLHPLWWAGVGAVLFAFDYAVGAHTQFPVVYVIPVTLAAWFSGRWAALALATAIPLVHIVFILVLWKPDSLVGPITATVFRASVITVMALWFARLAEHERELERHVQSLEGLLPICAFCKNIRNEAGEWEKLESFISTRSQAQFSHGFCPTCRDKHYPELFPTKK